ncbi:MAG: prepilin-type N-terminal cleavage/methylation domain-containing protein [Epsilonproteobacteria bacterium]|nr:prepilin-type N-terminal cleavage/methylation domain-containing protein [Campylobacterota bacterium]
MKKAFTMLELVFVIVVIGILAALILPRTKTNPVQAAAQSICFPKYATRSISP